eukprot:2420601-Amphidinium_carterae.1
MQSRGAGWSKRQLLPLSDQESWVVASIQRPRMVGWVNGIAVSKNINEQKDAHALEELPTTTLTMLLKTRMKRKLNNHNSQQSNNPAL